MAGRSFPTDAITAGSLSVWDRRHREMWTYAMPEGESYEMVARRAGATAAMIGNTYAFPELVRLRAAGTPA